MARIGCKDTKPELVVRRTAHALGYRYRLHRRDLPGTPDMVFPSRRKAIFVHGCFWHLHDALGCRKARLPKTRREFWKAKLEANRERDIRNRRALEGDGWNVLEIWGCELGDVAALERRLVDFLDG